MAVHTVYSGLMLSSATAKGTASAVYARGSNGNWYIQAVNGGGESALWKLEASFNNSDWATLATYTALSGATVAVQTGINAPYIRAKFATAWSGSNVTGIVSVYGEAGIV